ncbi:MAG: site-specific integrase [Candidatus Hydrogenedentes bacterium]|nr:site-specific integrase [Candidatus Hydrogenedentota bacterium]
MASLWKRGKMYYARYYVAGQQRAVCLHTTSHQTAKEKLNRFEVRLSERGEDALPTKTPVVKVLEAYIAHIQVAKTKAGVRSDLYYLRDIFGPVCKELEVKQKDARARAHRAYLPAKYLEQIRTQDIVAFVTARVQQRNLSAKTANQYRCVLSRVFSWSMSQFGVRIPGDANPARKVERYREPARTIRFLNVAQIAKQLDALAEDRLVQSLVAAYIYAGLRREEALWLTRHDLDFQKGKYGVILVQAKTIDGEFWEPKTKVNRAVPISRALRGYLDKYQPSIVPAGWYFPTPNGTRWDPDNFSQRLKELNLKAGLSWSCQDYRHTFGSLLASKGESLYKIATLMGNSPEICRRHYAALMPESLIDSVEFEAPRPQETPPPGNRPRLYILPHPADEQAQRA